MTNSTWARKATLRKNGSMMRTVSVQFHLDRESVAIVAAYKRSYTAEQATSRRELMELVEAFLHDKGVPCYVHIEGIEDDDRDEIMAAAYAEVDRLMPELKGKGPDLTRWMMTVLSNDEASTDDELYDMFTAEGVDPAEAKNIITQRDKFLRSI
jgi:hypothetical protein